MQIRISPHSGVPIYLQIVRQVTYLVASGRLDDGEEMPSIRELADQLTVNPNTVARAYRELEVAGIVTKRRATGTYVSETRAPLDREARFAVLTERADALLTEAWQMNVTTDEVVELVKQRGRMIDARQEEVHP